MDIYTAQSAADRLLKFIQAESSSTNKKYGKSLDRFQVLESTCQAIVEELHTYLGLKFSPSAVENIVPAPDTSPSSEIHGGPKHTKSQVIANYHVVLQKIANTRSGYHEVDAFTNVLKQWYEARFIAQGESPEFKCNTKYMGKWILRVAIGYGNALESGKGKDFLSAIETFSENLAQDFATSKYVLPYDIYQATKDVSGESVSLTGAVIWDILYDLGLNVLHPEQSDSYLPRDAAKQLYDARPDDAPYYYNHYKHSDKVRQRIKLIPYSVKEDSEC